MLQIDSETLRALGGADAVNQAVTAYSAALAAHASTVNKPAPVAANSVVETIVRRHGGQWEEVEPVSGKPPSDPDSFTSRLAALEAEAIALRGEVDTLKAR